MGQITSKWYIAPEGSIAKTSEDLAAQNISQRRVFNKRLTCPKLHAFGVGWLAPNYSFHLLNLDPGKDGHFDERSIVLRLEVECVQELVDCEGHRRAGGSGSREWSGADAGVIPFIDIDLRRILPLGRHGNYIKIDLPFLRD